MKREQNAWYSGLAEPTGEIMLELLSEFDAGFFILVVLGCLLLILAAFGVLGDFASSTDTLTSSLKKISIK